MLTHLKTPPTSTHDNELLEDFSVETAARDGKFLF
jgi:hypothetical protein